MANSTEVDGNIAFSDPKPSNVLLGMVEKINTSYGHLKNDVIGAYNQAISEGFSPEGAKRFIFENTEFSKRTIYRYLPEEAKNPNMGRPTLPVGNVEPIPDDLEQLRNTIHLKEQEIVELREELETKELSPDQKAQLAGINEKIHKHEQELLKFYKDVELPWCERKAETVLEWARELEIEYTILGKPLGNILKNIVYHMKFIDVAKGGAELIYETIPDKYKINYSKAQMLYEIYGDETT